MAIDFFDSLQKGAQAPSGETEPQPSIGQTVKEAEVGERGQLTGAKASDLLGEEPGGDDFFSRLSGEDPGDIAGAAGRGATAGLARTGLFLPGALAGGRLGAMGFAGSPVLGGLSTVGGALAGGLVSL